MLRHACFAIALGLIGLPNSGPQAAAQTSGAQQQQQQQRTAQALPFDCLDRCFAEFKACLGPPPDPNKPIPPPNGSSVPTPPPFEQCKRARDECEAQCLPPPRR